MEQGGVTVLVHCTSSQETWKPRLESFEPMVTKLRSGQGNLDNAEDQSNPYMSPSQANQKLWQIGCHNVTA